MEVSHANCAPLRFLGKQTGSASTARTLTCAMLARISISKTRDIRVIRQLLPEVIERSFN
jgi:hypothetical protein